MILESGKLNGEILNWDCGKHISLWYTLADGAGNKLEIVFPADELDHAIVLLFEIKSLIEKMEDE